ncbi:hypothetical protein QYM39_06070 [Pediococcus pentosaceus]|uniref:hypothetical protein n=1 Tax=Pediococcus pentosaceus TaxID=1255 RepID=UPI002657F4A5|nr:hypothetical protein [Pediococcus pentosaceus]WKF70474.1 hypothetical protein QYM39_06070 [Pediococcus pentosaceus]
MAKLIHSKFGYETREYIQADARLEKWLKQKKRGKSEMVRPFNLPKKERDKIRIDWR